MRRIALSSLVAGAALAVSVTVAAGPAPGRAPAPRPQQAVEHRAAVVVDTGSGVQYGCVRFTADSISGREALERAAMDPVFQEFGGDLGSAVCELCGTGCPVGSCLTCQSEVWSYWRAPAGGDYALSSLGVSNTEVRDGDIEGWVWGRGGPPPGVTVENVCGPAPPSPGTTPPPGPGPGPGPTPPPTGGGEPVVGSGSGGTGGAAGTGTGGSKGSSSAAGKDEASADGETAAAESGSGLKLPRVGKVKRDEGRTNDQELTAAAYTDGGGSGGPPASLLGFLALVVFLGSAALWIGHRRNHPGPESL
jgi:hypothetical protein